MTRAGGAPIFGLTLYLGMSVRVFPDDISIGINRLRKHMSLCNVGGHHSIHWGCEQQQQKRGQKGEFSLLAWLLSWNTGLFLTGDPGSQAFWLRLELHYSFFWFRLAFNLHNHVSQSCKHTYLFLCVVEDNMSTRVCVYNFLLSLSLENVTKAQG